MLHRRHTLGCCDPYGTKRSFEAHASAVYRTAACAACSALSCIALAAADDAVVTKWEDEKPAPEPKDPEPSTIKTMNPKDRKSKIL